VEGLLSQKASRQMLQASSQASCTPPSTNAAAEDSLLSIFAFSSISAARDQTDFDYLSSERFLHTRISGEIPGKPRAINRKEHTINNPPNFTRQIWPKRQQMPQN
jgi:uncharacterized caspase-like protein